MSAHKKDLEGKNVQKTLGAGFWKKKEKTARGCEKDFVFCHSREKEAINQVIIF